jgi:hypothetical protein
MKILESKFLDINTDEVLEFINDRKRPYVEYTPIKGYAPQLFFHDEQEFEDGYYDFEVNGLIFTQCFIRCIAYGEGGYYYEGSSYCVMTE